MQWIFLKLIKEQLCSIMGHYGALWNIMERYGVLWGNMVTLMVKAPAITIAPLLKTERKKNAT